jgi:hypothetical protein
MAQPSNAGWGAYRTGESVEKCETTIDSNVDPMAALQSSCSEVSRGALTRPQKQRHWSANRKILKRVKCAFSPRSSIRLESPRL